MKTLLLKIIAVAWALSITYSCKKSSDTPDQPNLPTAGLKTGSHWIYEHTYPGPSGNTVTQEIEFIAQDTIVLNGTAWLPLYSRVANFNQTYSLSILLRRDGNNWIAKNFVAQLEKTWMYYSDNTGLIYTTVDMFDQMQTTPQYSGQIVAAKYLVSTDSATQYSNSYKYFGQSSNYSPTSGTSLTLVYSVATPGLLKEQITTINTAQGSLINRWKLKSFTL